MVRSGCKFSFPFYGSIVATELMKSVSGFHARVVSSDESANQLTIRAS